MSNIPLAIQPSERTPGVATLIDLTAGAPSPGTGALRALIIGVINTSGSTITVDTQLEQSVIGESGVAVLAGSGGPTHLLARRLTEEFGVVQFDLACAAEAAGNAATGTCTLSGVITELRVIRSVIAGRVIESNWAAGESVTVAADRHVLAVNAKTADLPVIASNVAGVITYTFKAKGRIGNDCKIRCTLVGGVGGSVALSGAKLTGGTADPDWANVLALAAGRRYHYISFVASNTDVTTAAGTAPAKAKAHIELYNFGLTAKHQQAMHACTDATSAALKVVSAAINHEYTSLTLARDWESLPCEMLGAAMGQRMREMSKNPNFNRIGMAFKATLYPPADLVSGPPSPSEVSDDLQYGISPISCDEGGVAFTIRPITSYYKVAGTGDADDRVLDDTVPTSCIYVAEDLATFLATQFPNLNILDDQADEAAEEEVPEGCVTITEVSDAVEGRMALHIRKGIVRKDKFAEAIESGAFIVRVNPDDGHQVDYVVPLDIVKHLAKHSLVILNKP